MDKYPDVHLEPKTVIETIYGNCPVQAEGTINGTPFYFRARGSRWSLSVGADPVGAPDWTYEEPYGKSLYDAGWMMPYEADTFIRNAAIVYAQSLDRNAPEASDGQGAPTDKPQADTEMDAGPG